MIERRTPFVIDEAKFSTQRVVTYALLTLLYITAIDVAIVNDQSERSTMIQTVINLTMLAVGFWIGTSKGEVDKAASMSRIAEAVAPSMVANGHQAPTTEEAP